MKILHSLIVVLLLLIAMVELVTGRPSYVGCGLSDQWVVGQDLPNVDTWRRDHGTPFTAGGAQCSLTINPDVKTFTAGQKFTVTLKSSSPQGYKVEATVGKLASQSGGSAAGDACLNYDFTTTSATMTWTAPANGNQAQIRAICSDFGRTSFVAAPITLAKGDNANGFDFEFAAGGNAKIFTKALNNTHLKIRMNYTVNGYVGFGPGTVMIGSTVIIGMDPVVNTGSPAVGVYKLLSEGGSKNADILQNVAVTPNELKAIGITDASFVSTNAFGSSLTFTLELAKQPAAFTVAKADQSKLDLIYAGGPANANGAFCKNNVCFQHDNAAFGTIPQVSFALGPDDPAAGGVAVGVDLGTDLTVHIITMIVGWGILIPLGVLIPLYNNIKYSPSGRALCGISGPNWVKYHWVLQSIGLILTYAGSISGINSVGLHFKDFHSILGFLLLAGSILQPVVAFLRPDKSVTEGARGLIRKMFDSGHLLFGYVLVFAALIENVIGVQEVTDRLGGALYNLLGSVGEGGFAGPLGAFVVVLSAGFGLLLIAGLLRAGRTKLMHSGSEPLPYQNMEDKNGYPTKQPKKVYVTMDEVAAHNSVQSCWVIYKKRVYDVTSFLNSHPGGKKVIVPYAGKDMTTAYDENGHSAEANTMLSKYFIGELQQNNRRTGSLSQRISAKFQDLKQYAGSMMPDGFDSARLSKAVSRFSSDMRNGGIKSAYNGLTVRPQSDAGSAFRFLKNNSERKRVVLSEKLQMSHNTYYFKFSFPGNPQMVLGLPTGKHISLYAPVQPGTQKGKWNNESDPESSKKEISRKYTPVTADEVDVGYFALVVKVYRPSPQFPDGGRMSRFLENLRVGQTIEISGPVGSHHYVGKGRFIDSGREVLFNSCGMIAGGSGITPVLQIASAMLRDPKDNTKISLIYANSTVDDILMKDHLDEMERQYPTRFRVWYTVSQDPKNSGNPMFSFEWKYSVGRITKLMLSKRLPQASSSSIVMQCGPKSMMESVNRFLHEMGYPEERIIEY